MKYFVFAITLLLMSCAGNPRVEDLSSANRAKAASMEVYRGAPPTRDFTVISQVHGLSCNRNKYEAQDVSKSEALQGIKINAALAGADAVINTFCQKNSDVDWRNNCWASVKCIGDAVKYDR